MMTITVLSLLTTENDRIVEWKMGASHRRVIAGGQGRGNRLDQVYWPTDVLIDKETNSLFIVDQGNGRVLRWSRRRGTTQGEIIVDNIDCWGLAMDEQRHLYVSDTEKHEVRRYTIGDKNGHCRSWWKWTRQSIESTQRSDLSLRR